MRTNGPYSAITRSKQHAMRDPFHFCEERDIPPEIAALHEYARYSTKKREFYPDASVLMPLFWDTAVPEEGAERYGNSTELFEGVIEAVRKKSGGIHLRSEPGSRGVNSQSSSKEMYKGESDEESDVPDNEFELSFVDIDFSGLVVDTVTVTDSKSKKEQLMPRNSQENRM